MYFYRYPLILTILNGAVSLLGDEILKWNAHSLLAKVICDNLTHAINGILCALIITLRANYPITWNERMLLMQCGGLVASFIDLDHFIAARSVVLQVHILCVNVRMRIRKHSPVAFFAYITESRRHWSETISTQHYHTHSSHSADRPRW